MSQTLRGLQDNERSRLRRAGQAARAARPGAGTAGQVRMATRLGPARARAATARAAPQADTGAAPKTPFVLLVLGLLGGGLVCLLVINTTLGAASFKISQLQQTGSALAQQEQSLQREVSAQEAPAQIEQRAYRLGMRPQSTMHFLELAAPVASPARSPVSARNGKPSAVDRKEPRR
jgi:hypothetical protein